MKVGAHTSISGGMYRALERGAQSGCDVVQVFVRPNRNWRVKPLTAADVERWEETRRRTGVQPAMAHSSYLINVGSPRAATWKRSVTALGDEYRRCARLGIPALVMHPGAHMGSGEAAGIARIARAVNRVLEEHPEHSPAILFENTAGQGTCVGYRFEHLRDLLGAVEDPRRKGVCIDTCHTLAAGYDITTPTSWGEVIDELQRVVGCRWVKAIHVNDSKRPLGARVDRHEHLGRGFLGLSPFRCLVNEPRLANRPMTIETPKETPHADPINLAILRALVGLQRVGARARRLSTQPMSEPPRI